MENVERAVRPSRWKEMACRSRNVIGALGIPTAIVAAFADRPGVALFTIGLTCSAVSAINVMREHAQDGHHEGGPSTQVPHINRN